MHFIETPVFTRSIRGLLAAEEYRHLQVALLLRPEQGVLIRGSGGPRKVRWGGTGRGKRGGLRIIYYWCPGEAAFYLLLAHAKGAQDDLTPAQARALGRSVREEFR